MVGKGGGNQKQTLWSLAMLLLLPGPVGATLVVALCPCWCAQAAEHMAGAVGATLVVAPGHASSQAAQDIDDITGKYHFLSPDDTLGILEEEGKLKGYIEIVQGEEESDAVLTYDIASGSRKKDHVEFKTNTIHRRYYRFSGKVERGSGRGPHDPDYLRLIGDLETVIVKGDSGQESVEKKHLILKSLGKSESNEQ
jgi:hypothetical protein